MAADTPSPWALRWNDPGGLAPTTQQDFAERLAARMGHAVFDSSADEPALAVNWSGSSERCAVELQIVSGSQVEGSRMIQSPGGDCRALVPALLTVAALLVEARNVEVEPIPPPPVEPPKPDPPPAVRKPPVPVRPESPRPSAPTLLMSLGAGLDIGLAPRLELGPAAAVVFSPSSHLRLGAQAALFFPHQYGSRPSLSLAHQSGGLLACVMPLTGWFALGLCSDALLHNWRSTGISLPRPAARRTASWTWGLAARAEWRLTGRVWWVGSLGASVLTRPLYFYYTTAPGDEATLFRQRRVAPTSFLGLSLELP